MSSDIPTSQYVIAGMVIALMVAVIIWLNVGGWKERRRRKTLSPEEQKRLKDDDDWWSQHYGF